MIIWQQYQRISRFLSGGVKLRVRSLAPLFFARASSRTGPPVLHRLAIEVLRCQFIGLSPEDLDVLAFYLLGVAAAAEENGQMNQILLNDLGKDFSPRMQIVMDRRSRFISTLSNILERVSTTADTVVQNIK
jgi:hypothetical protein